MVLSFTEVEYVALFQVAKESMWMVEDLGVAIQDAMMVNVDNQESIALASNLVSIPTFSTITLGAWSRRGRSV